MAATPPPAALRAHTPPTPLHGARYDNYEPYSPRRSKRSTAQSNPYSSFNSERSPNTPPPTTTKKARFARPSIQLSSPPSSPASPRQRVNLSKTPRKHSRKPFTTTTSDSEGTAGPSSSKPTSLAPAIDPITMLPTPSKTPNKNRSAASKANAITNTARILSFQPNHPNDAMPSPRRIKSSKNRALASKAGFELYEDGMGLDGAKEAEIEIYTDANARVPVLDESEDNPFVGPKKHVRPQQRRKQRTAQEEDMDQRVGRGEGVVYVFRGKKIFRAFADGEAEGAEEDASTPDQRRLKRQAGEAAQRPLTRSAIKPRLLFPSEPQCQERDAGADDVDEEAVTDIEMDVAQPTLASNGDESLVSPPPTHKKRTRTVKIPLDRTPAPIEEDEPEPMSLGTDESFASTSSAGKGKGKAKSPFDTWQRTKSARKRAGEAVEESGGTKRTRGAML